MVAKTRPAAARVAPAPARRRTHTLVVDAVAYHLTGHTASGLPVAVGVVAVDPTVIPLGTRLFVPGYGPAVAADVGTAVKGNIIDLWMPDQGAGPGLGPAHRHDHRLRLTTMRVRTTCILGIVVLSLLTAAPWLRRRRQRPGSPPRLSRALSGPYLAAGRTAAIAIDLETGTVLFAHNDTKPVIPASNEKLPVAWAALVKLGPAYRFHTELYGVGGREGSTWEGDLVLKGFGDPTLATSDLAGLAHRLRALGITAVTGRVRGDESFYDHARGVASWKRGFLGIESPPLSALVVDRAAGWPALSPPLLAAKGLTEQLAAAGVSVAGRPGLGVATAAAVPLASDRSVPLADDPPFHGSRERQLHRGDAASSNWPPRRAAAGTTAGGAHVIVQAMKQASIPISGVRIADGSGLSPDDRLTTAAIVGVFEAAWSDPAVRAPFVRSLAVAGTSGTLRNRLPQLKGIVRAKTGTTDLACSLSGFVADRFAFAIVENGSPVAYWVARQAQDRFVTLLAGRDEDVMDTRRGVCPRPR